MNRVFELNPVLVKEIRQAQRGKVFPLALIGTVSVALLSCLMFAISEGHSSHDRSLGPAIFQSVYWLLSGALLLLVPFQAFVSMGAEWDDNTFELLILSNLKPAQILGGKIFAAMTQALLLFATFLPFVAVAFLMQGVGVVTLALILVLTLIASLILITGAVALSTLTRKRFLRVLLMILLALGLVMIVGASMEIASDLIRRPDTIDESEFWLVLIQFVIFFGFVGVLAFFMSCNMLAHEEENRSSNVRILVSLALLFYLIAMAFNARWPSVSIPRDAVFGVTTLIMFLLGAVCAMFCFEPERLGRRVLSTVPKNPRVAFFVAPWFPGGGNGVIFLLLHLTVLVCGALFIANWPGHRLTSYRSSGSDSLLSGGGYSMLAGLLYVLLYTLFTIGVLYRWASTARRRYSLRVATLCSPLFYLLVPAAFGLLVGNWAWQDMQHIGNPGELIGDSGRGHFSENGYVVVLVLAAFIGLMMNAGRMLGALESIRAASKARVAREKEEAKVTGELAGETGGEVTDA
ncbi:MAG: hypothetical protein GY930_00015 [bacterium]|nr:hypothetical protein [bacterium]